MKNKKFKILTMKYIISGKIVKKKLKGISFNKAIRKQLNMFKDTKSV